MALMTSTGAKGSQVNFSQISCLLGQQVSRAAPVPVLGRLIDCHNKRADLPVTLPSFTQLTTADAETCAQFKLQMHTCNDMPPSRPPQRHCICCPASNCANLLTASCRPQTLEGRRVPRMSSGKTLPCFAPYDGGARSGGFVGDRFLDGLRPQVCLHCANN